LSVCRRTSRRVCRFDVAAQHEGIESHPHGLTKDEKIWLEDHFQEQCFCAHAASIDPAHPFPFIPKLFFDGASVAQSQERREMSAPLRLLRCSAGPQEQCPLHPARRGGRPLYRQAFPGYEVKGSGTFRIIRDSDIEVEEVEDLVRLFETALKRRRRGSASASNSTGRCRTNCASSSPANSGVVEPDQAFSPTAGAQPDLRSSLFPATIWIPPPLPLFLSASGNMAATASPPFAKDIIVHHP
jgi:hypothetical protein